MLTNIDVKSHEGAIFGVWALGEQKSKCGGVCGWIGFRKLFKGLMKNHKS